jgi:hypothetical protein
MTHRIFSKNAASSRAIPLKTMIGLVWNKPAEFVHWGKNQSGMSAKEELSGWRLKVAKAIWKYTGRAVCVAAWVMEKIGLHKQCANRMLEPWSHIKVVLTGTDFENFFHLRTHKDAQPEFQVLAKSMLKDLGNSKPKVLREGEWHLPYIDKQYKDLSLEKRIKLSASLCAQVSYRKQDDSIEKALKIYDRLVESTPVHASPFEHQATPLNNPNESSGNFKGWKQNRQTIKNNVFPYEL